MDGPPVVPMQGPEVPAPIGFAGNAKSPRVAGAFAGQGVAPAIGVQRACVVRTAPHSTRSGRLFPFHVPAFRPAGGCAASTPRRLADVPAGVATCHGGRFRFPREAASELETSVHCTLKACRPYPG